jgi:membrane peptidoglycan carboxypeptidase
MVGSRDFFEDPIPEGCTPGKDCKFEPNVNVAVRSRQPGSAFKPFVYATAFEKGYTDNTILFDLFTEFNAACGPDGTPRTPGAICYHPRNFDGLFRGPVNIRTALANSINVPAVKALYLAGIDDVIRTAEDVGISTFTDRSRYGLSLVLGGAEVQLVELTAAYGVLATEGIRNPTVGILRIEDNEGNVIKEFEESPVRVIDEEITRIVTDILSDNEARVPVFGPNNRLAFYDRPVAAKTGSTNDFRDGWSFGYTPSLAVGVWAGNNDNSSMNQNAPGVSVASPIWRTFLEAAFSSENEDETPKFPVESFTEPEPRPRNKPVLNGEYLVEGEAHTILHYIDREDPLGEEPRTSDPLYQNWESSVRQWFGGSGIQSSGGVITLVSPASGSLIGDSFIARARSSEPDEIERVEFYFDNALIEIFDGGSESYEARYEISPGTASGSHQVRVRAYLEDDEVEESSVTVIIGPQEGAFVPVGPSARIPTL